MKEQKNFKERGITLVALVVTIIILLILAGISIATLTGSGLFEKARLAEQQSKNAQELEDSRLGEYENKIAEYIDGSRDIKNINYSLEEQDTGLKWIDGKTIYQKTFVSEPFAFNTTRKWTTVKDDIISNMDFIIDIEGIIKTPSTTFEVGFASSTSTYADVEIWDDTLGLVTSSGSALGESRFYITLMYTKK